MRRVTVYKEVFFMDGKDFPLTKWDIVSNNTFMKSDKQWSMITCVKRFHKDSFRLILVPLSNFGFFRFFQKWFLILTANDK